MEDYERELKVGYLDAANCPGDTRGVGPIHHRVLPPDRSRVCVRAALDDEGFLFQAIAFLCAISNCVPNQLMNYKTGVTLLLM